jgi:hypothetical protein
VCGFLNVLEQEQLRHETRTAFDKNRLAFLLDSIHTFMMVGPANVFQRSGGFKQGMSKKIDWDALFYPENI